MTYMYSVTLFLHVLQVRLLKVMVGLSSSGPQKLKREINCGRHDTMHGMLTWLLDLVVR